MAGDEQGNDAQQKRHGANAFCQACNPLLHARQKLCDRHADCQGHADCDQQHYREDQGIEGRLDIKNPCDEPEHDWHDEDGDSGCEDLQSKDIVAVPRV